MESADTTVLVIDRAADLRYLEGCAFEMIETEDTFRALCALAKRPDVAVLFSDVMLSRMTGEELRAYLCEATGKLVVLHGAEKGVARIDEVLSEPPQSRWRAWLQHLAGLVTLPFRRLRRRGKAGRPEKPRRLATT